MSIAANGSPDSGGAAIRYEPDEPCPPLTLVGVGLQGMMLILATIIATVAVTGWGASQDDAYLQWAVFAALMVAGALIALQASRVWQIGAGHLVLMGASPNFVAVSVLALEAGGPALMASLTAASSLFYLMLARWLPRLRRIVTPVVTGTVVMLIAVSILPIVLERIREAQEGASTAAGPVVALVTLAVATVLGLRAPRVLRPWSPLLALLAGCVTAASFGIYGLQPVREAAWAGIPTGGFPGLDLTLGLDFWTLLPAFVVITLMGGVKNTADSVILQQASRRRPKVTDFRLVQGALHANFLGILLSGLAGTVATTFYTSRTLTLMTLTSVAARRVGYVVGATIAVLALFPKLVAVLISIPSPVMGAYILLAVGMLFVNGVQTLTKDGLDAQKVLIASVSFAVGASLDQQTLFADLLGEGWSPLLDNGVVAGAATAILLTLFLDATSPARQARLEVELSSASLPELDEFLDGIAARIGWNQTSRQRLRSAGEEALMSLVEPEDLEMLADGQSRHLRGDRPARFIVIARSTDSLVELEFLAVFDEENLEERLAYLSEEVEGSHGWQEGEISLRLLRHYASSVHHQKYHGLDIVTVQVRGSR